MHFSTITCVALTLVVSSIAGPLAARHENVKNPRDYQADEMTQIDDDKPLQRICTHLNTQNKGCVRYTRGFDVTGVVTEVDLTFPQVKNACDCIQECLLRPTTCASYVYKFSTADSVRAGHRTCTLYSQFNLPSTVNIQINVNASQNVALLQPGNNPQTGAVVAQTFKDVNLNTIADNDAFSGPVWQLANGKAQC